MPIDERPRFDRSPGPQPRRAPAPGHHVDLTRRGFLTKASAVAGAVALSPLLPSRFALASPAATPTDQAVGANAFGSGLDDFIRNRMHVAILPSLSGAAVSGVDLVWSKGYGLADREQSFQADADTDYMLASVSKTFIVAALMQLWEDGSIDIDADVNNYLPFEVRNPAFPNTPITARMLLTHTSSIRDRYGVWGTIANPTPDTGYTTGDSPLPLADVLAGYLVPGGAYFIDNRCYYPNRPGTEYRYSNLGADLAAYLVEVISGTLYSQYVTDNLLVPLGMVESGYHLSDLSTTNLAVPYKCNTRTRAFTPYPQYGYADYPCGCMRTSANALSIWLRTFMNGGLFGATRILKKSTVNEIMRAQIDDIIWGQGLIWYYIRESGRTLVGHNGGDFGVSTNMYFSPSAGTGAITLTNRYIGGWTAWYAFLDIQDKLFDLL